MQQLIATFLFTHNRCTLPGIGELNVHHRSAVYMQGDQSMYPPEVEVRLMESDLSDNAFVKFIALNLNVSVTAAKNRLDQFCKEVLTPGTETVIDSLGTIVVDDYEKVSFVEHSFPAYSIAVPAQRVVRQTPHALIVGENESTSEIMSAYYAGQQNSKKSFWWAWAIGIFLITAILITYYIISGDFNATFGSQEAISRPEIPSTYKSVP